MRILFKKFSARHLLKKAISFGVHLPVMNLGDNFTHSREQILSFAERAEKLGYDSLSVNDHIVFNTSWLDSISTLSAVAAVTTDKNWYFNIECCYK